jgi:hypothetical protein
MIRLAEKMGLNATSADLEVARARTRGIAERLEAGPETAAIHSDLVELERMIGVAYEKAATIRRRLSR